MGSRINVRLNEIVDKDIIDALSNVKDITKEVKKLLRLGMHGTSHTPIPNVATGKVLRPVAPKINKVVPMNDISELEANLLANFNFSDDDE